MIVLDDTAGTCTTSDTLSLLSSFIRFGAFLNGPLSF